MSTYHIPHFGSGLPQSVKSFLFPSICMQNSRCHCFLPLNSKVYRIHTFFNHSSIEGYLGCFHVLAITNSAAMNIVEQMLLYYDRASLGYIPKSGIAGS